MTRTGSEPLSLKRVLGPTFHPDAIRLSSVSNNAGGVIKSDTAEAGLFQMSWDANRASPLIEKLFSEYSKNPQGFLSIFQEGVICGHHDLANYGDGDGAAFQQLCKSCPAFAVEAAAVTQQAVVEVEERLFRGHLEVVDADLADYFESIPHAELRLRVLGKHWGPIKNRAAEIRPEADDLFQRVQSIVDAHA
jgi:hypothetical protein